MAETESIFAGIEPTEKGLRALDRIKERFAVATLPKSFTPLAGSESGASDIYMNLNRQFAEGKLAEKTKLIVAVAVAAVSGSPRAVDFFADAAFAKGRTKSEILDAISAGSVCSIFNGYYRFRDQVPADEKAAFEAFRAPFNANTFMKCALEHFEVEAICVAVSSINNCHICVEGHLHKARSLGMTNEQVDELIRSAAAAAATARLLSAFGEATVAPSPAVAP